MQQTATLELPKEDINPGGAIPAALAIAQKKQSLEKVLLKSPSLPTESQTGVREKVSYKPQFVESSSPQHIEKKQFEVKHSWENKLKVKFIQEFAVKIGAKYPDIKISVLNAVDAKCKTIGGQYISNALDGLLKALSNQDPTILNRFNAAKQKVLDHEARLQRKKDLEARKSESIEGAKKLKLKDFTTNIGLFSKLSKEGILPFSEGMKMKLIQAIINNYSKEFSNYSVDREYKSNLPDKHINKMLRYTPDFQDKFREVVTEVMNYERSNVGLNKSRIAKAALQKFDELATMFG